MGVFDVVKAYTPWAIRRASHRVKREVRWARNARQPVGKVFEDVYNQGMWGGEQGKFYSGPGSEGDAARIYAQGIRGFITERNISSVVDLGCGDFACRQPVSRRPNDLRGRRYRRVLGARERSQVPAATGSPLHASTLSRINCRKANSASSARYFSICPMPRYSRSCRSFGNSGTWFTRITNRDRELDAYQIAISLMAWIRAYGWTQPCSSISRLSMRLCNCYLRIPQP